MSAPMAGTADFSAVDNRTVNISVVELGRTRDQVSLFMLSEVIYTFDVVAIASQACIYVTPQHHVKIASGVLRFRNCALP